MTMDRWRGKVAVVTGASAGIGLAVAKALVNEGMIVVGLARREDKMIQEMSGVKSHGQFHARACDVSKEQDVIEAFEYVKQTFKSLSVLINNAGIIKMKSIEESDTAELEQIINVNLMGLLYCSKHGVKLMKETSSEGHIVNINSVAGHKVPNMSWFGGNKVNVNVYPATKFAVTALSEVFTNELLGDRIRVTNLSPGYVLTDIFEQRDLESNGLINNPALKSEDIADAIVYVIGTPTHVQITQLTIKPLGEPF